MATTVLSPYEADIVRGVIRYSDHAGNWSFFSFQNRPYADFEHIDLSQVEGVIGGFYDERWIDDVKRSGVVAVNTSNSLADADLPRVGVDDLAIGRMGAEHLLERGYPNFGFLVRGQNWYSKRRLEGFRAVIETQTGGTCHVLQPPANLSEDDEAPLPRWLAKLPKPIGIMAANDVRARQVIDCAVGLNLRVPEEVGVLGVDNDEFASVLAARSLSSIELDGHETGYRAAQMLEALLAGEKPNWPYWTKPLGILTRRSTDVTISQDTVVSNALRYIREHCAERITVEEVLAVVGVSQTTLEVRMKRAIGKTPHAAISQARVERAKQQLIGSASTIGEIARHCGFDRQERFNVVFKRLTGMTPSQFRKQRLR